jgi:transposase
MKKISLTADQKETFEVEYTVSGLNKWLHQHQFSYKQPKGVPHKFNTNQII